MSDAGVVVLPPVSAPDALPEAPTEAIEAAAAVVDPVALTEVAVALTAQLIAEAETKSGTIELSTIESEDEDVDDDAFVPKGPYPGPDHGIRKTVVPLVKKQPGDTTNNTTPIAATQQGQKDVKKKDDKKKDDKKKDDSKKDDKKKDDKKDDKGRGATRT